MTEPIPRLIKCRSQKSKDCYELREDADGQRIGTPVWNVYGEDGMETDGTWDGRTVVCDACYIAIGQPSVDITDPRARTFGPELEGGKGPPEWP